MGLVEKAAMTMKKSFYRYGMTSVLVLVLSLVSRGLEAENALTVGTATAQDGNVADIPLKMSGDKDVQAFIMVLEWNGSRAKGVDLVPSTNAGEALEKANLIVKRVENSYMVFSTVMDMDGTGGEKIPAGQNIRIGTAKIRCQGPAEGTQDTELKLVDGKYATVDGGPLLSNLLTIGGRTVGVNEGLKLHNGSISCEGITPTEEVVFICGGPLEDDGKPKQVEGSRKTTQKIHFYYKSPAEGSGNKNKIQGLSISVKFHKDLTCLADTFSIEDGVLKQVNAEFVHLEVDNLVMDGDAASLTLGVLVDAVAPYDGRTLPSTKTYKELFSIDFTIEHDAECGLCHPIEFVDGGNGNGQVAVFNLVSINFFSKTPKLESCSICVDGGEAKFIRGDCNFSFGSSHPVDISDAAAMVGYFFLEGDAHFAAPCDDACDANDDGRLDAADIVFLLNYLFVPGSPFPPAPGPKTPGVDPTSDNLGCSGAQAEC